MRAQRAAAAELHDPARALGPQRHDVLDGQQLGAQPARLVGGAPRQVGAAQAGREAEVVLDPARLAGLPAGRLALDHHRAQALGGAVDRRRQPGGPAADDDQVVVLLGGLAADAEALGELEHRRPLEHRAVLEQRHRQPVGVDADDLEQLARLAVALDVEPARRARGCGPGSRAARASPCEKRWPMTRTPPDSSAAPASQVVEQVLDDREQLLLGRVPRLEQVVVERDLVDGRRSPPRCRRRRSAARAWRRGRAVRASTRYSVPAMTGMRWSAISSATWSPRARTSRSSSSASGPEPARRIR